MLYICNLHKYQSGACFFIHVYIYIYIYLQYFLHVLGQNVSAKYRSGSTVLHDVRPLSSGTQSYDTKKIEWPLNEPLKKLEANIQVYYDTMYPKYSNHTPLVLSSCESFIHSM